MLRTFVQPVASVGNARRGVLGYNENVLGERGRCCIQQVRRGDRTLQLFRHAPFQLPKKGFVTAET
ncbi:MAG: hypothetical protein M3Y56_03175 [Armatimonadota bacterium]|nr:hypothetical protein [Armatimonadota bacterium]